MANVTYDAGMRSKAKDEGRILVAFDFDDRHVPRAKGGGVGRFTIHAPADPKVAQKLLDFVLKMCKAKEL